MLLKKNIPNAGKVREKYFGIIVIKIKFDNMVTVSSLEMWIPILCKHFKYRRNQ